MVDDNDLRQFLATFPKAQILSFEKITERTPELLAEAIEEGYVERVEKPIRSPRHSGRPVVDIVVGVRITSSGIEFRAS